MKISTRFSIAVHILTLIDYEKGTPVSSMMIAGSVNTNPVIIRRILGLLKEAGFVEVLRGPQGSILKKPVDDITLLDVFKAVNSLENEELFDIHDSPNPRCPIGANIQNSLELFMVKSQEAMELVLADVTLRDIINQMKLNK